MSLEKNIEEKLKASLKNKDKTVYPTLRLIISSIKDFKIHFISSVSMQGIQELKDILWQKLN